MDEWNDFGPSPPFCRVSDDLAAPIVSEPSSAEPPSVMLRRSPPPLSSSSSSSSGSFTRRAGKGVRRGDMDDDSDVALSSAGGTSYYSSGRFHQKSYTKLEVISSVQIKSLLLVFHAFIMVAAVLVLITIILTNTVFLKVMPVFMPASLLTQEQMGSSDTTFSGLGTTPGPPMAARMVRAPAAGQTLAGKQAPEAGQAPAGERPQLDGQKPAGETAPVRRPTDNPRLLVRCSALSQGIIVWLSEAELTQREDCCDVKHRFHKGVQEYCSRAKFPIGPPGNATTAPGSRITNGTVANESTLGIASQPLPDKVRASPAPQSGMRGPSPEIGSSAPPGFVDPTKTKVGFGVFRVAVPWKKYKLVTHAAVMAMGGVMFCAGTLFLIRISKVGRCNLTQEQILAACLLFATFMYLNVPLSMIQYASAKTTEQVFLQWFNELEVPLRCLRDSASSPFMFFYVWASLDAYRILDPDVSLGFFSFYLPKFAIIVPYALLKLAAYFFAGFYVSKVPLLSVFILINTFGKLQVWRTYRVQLALLIAISIFDVLLIGIMVWKGIQTTKALRKAPYMRYRRKHIGFRFFLYMTTMYCAMFFLLHLFLLIGIPKGELVIMNGLTTDLWLFIPWTHTLGPTLLSFMYALLCSYVNLPYNSVGVVKGWFFSSDLAPSSSTWSALSSDDSSSAGYSRCESEPLLPTDPSSCHSKEHLPSFIVDKDYELNQEVIEPITYRKREPHESLELKANCFTMQTHVIMFNFAWYVYYYGTPKLDNLKPKETVLPFKFKIAESIFSRETDTHALVIDGVDRIVVAFKGTTSKRNLQTSMKIYHERLANVVPTHIDEVDEYERLSILFGGAYDAAKIHKGFACAYASVAKRVMRRIKALLDEHSRPVFLTGHSLGGALATICSLDVWVKLRISRRQIFVSTFGSPRVGNNAFMRIYNSVIALHWRIVIDPDMVAKLPKVGYRHVGKKVLMTPDGEMFIDPSALELKLWSGNTAGFAYHRKASYLLAMRAWCLRHHKLTYTPVFWPFPVREDDLQRFEGAEVEGKSGMGEGKEMATKIIRMDAMVDFLDDDRYDNMAAIERWARLSRRLLLSSKLSGMNRASTSSPAPSHH